MQNTFGYEPDLSSARDVIRRSAQQLRQDAARYASPALTFTAAPTLRCAPQGMPAGESDLAALKQMDALLLGNAYSDATYIAILDQLQGYLTTLSKLRRMPLGEAKEHRRYTRCAQRA